MRLGDLRELHAARGERREPPGPPRPTSRSRSKTSERMTGWGRSVRVRAVTALRRLRAPRPRIVRSQVAIHSEPSFSRSGQSISATTMSRSTSRAHAGSSVAEVRPGRQAVRLLGRQALHRLAPEKVDEGLRAPRRGGSGDEADGVVDHGRAALRKDVLERRAALALEQRVGKVPDRDETLLPHDLFVEEDRVEDVLLGLGVEASRATRSPPSGEPVSRTDFARMYPQTARIVPEASGSRMRILPFHFGSSRSSHSRGASAAAIAFEL